MQFKTPVIVVGNNNISLPHQWDTLKKRYPIIALDGAVNFLTQKQINFEYVIGDMDSIDLKIKNSIPMNKQLVISEQDTTDFEKALYTLEAPEYHVFGCFGEDIAHSLGAIHVMRKFAHKKITLYTQSSLSFVISRSTHLSLPKNTKVSLIPLEKTLILKSDGFFYPLDGLTLELGKSSSISNKTNKNTQFIEIVSGSLFVIFENIDTNINSNQC